MTIPVGINVFSRKEPLLSAGGHRNKVQLHFALNFLGAMLVAVGFWAVWQNKEDHGKTHWKSWHGLFGLYATLLLCAQVGTSLPPLPPMSTASSLFSPPPRSGPRLVRLPV